MVTSAEIVFYVAGITGLPTATVYAVKRRLIESGDWPSSRGAHVPKLTLRHVALMILALLADVKAADAAAAANAYYALTDADGAKLGDVLVDILDSMKDESSPLAQIGYKSRLEVDSGKPRACLTTQCTDGHAQTLYGVQREQWDDLSVRSSTTISGKCLYDLARGYHWNLWPKDVGKRGASHAS